jgi:hypothetical protein
MVWLGPLGYYDFYSNVGLTPGIILALVLSIYRRKRDLVSRAAQTVE